MSNFTFLPPEWPLLYEAAIKAEGMVNLDARAARFYTRRTLELAVVWPHKRDRSLRLPYQDHLSALIHELSFATPSARRCSQALLIKDLGNLAVHSTRRVMLTDARTATRELFHPVTGWHALRPTHPP